MNFLKLEEVANFNIDSPSRTILHGKIIRNKKFLYRLYKDWYNKLLQLSEFDKKNVFIELGSGAGIIKDFAPEVITSDVMSFSNLDKIIFADSIPFESNSVDGIVLVDVLHHIPNVHDFLIEANRVLKIGGVIILSEPWNCPWSKFIYTHFHHEPFDVHAGWEIEKAGPLSGANGALPWIIFKRDAKKFAEEFPDFQIELIKPHSATRYLLSGGVSYKQLVPDFSFKFFTALDKFLQFINVSMFAFILIRKIK